jgi:putative transposase
LGLVRSGAIPVRPDRNAPVPEKDPSNSFGGLFPDTPECGRSHRSGLSGVFPEAKNGENPGYPRFKGKGQYSSLTFPQWKIGCDLTGNGLRLSKIGTVPVVLHRPVSGKIKTCTVLRSSTGKWWVTLSCENVPERVLPPNPLPVGIDVGIKTFAALSDGTVIENPKFLKRSAKRLAQAQRKLERETKGSPERTKTKKVVAKIHERTAFRRSDFAHQESRKIVHQYGRIFVEDITVNEMNSHRCLNRSIRDVAWSQFSPSSRTRL